MRAIDAGVAQDVGQRLLDEAEDQGLQVRVEALVERLERELDLEAGALLEGAGEPGEGGREP